MKEGERKTTEEMFPYAIGKHAEFQSKLLREGLFARFLAKFTGSAENGGSVPEIAPFDYIVRWPQLYGEANMEQILTQAVRRAQQGRKQAIAVVGPLGAGKSTTRNLLAAYFKDALPDSPISSITAEQSLREVTDRTSGNFTAKDYQEGSRQLKINILAALKESLVTIIEAPVITGFSSSRILEKEGMDRGTSAFVELFGPQGKITKLVNRGRLPLDLSIIALSICQSYQNALDYRRARDIRRQHGFYIPGDEEEGGSHIGTLKGDEDIKQMLKANNYSIARAVGIPRKLMDLDLYEHPEFRGYFIGGLENWILETQIKPPASNTMIGLNDYMRLKPSPHFTIQPPSISNNFPIR